MVVRGYTVAPKVREEIWQWAMQLDEFSYKTLADHMRNRWATGSKALWAEIAKRITRCWAEKLSIITFNRHSRLWSWKGRQDNNS